jgi:hypothetical protein
LEYRAEQLYGTYERKCRRDEEREEGRKRERETGTERDRDRERERENKGPEDLIEEFEKF